VRANSPQNAMIASCSARTLGYPRAAAAALSPPYCLQTVGLGTRY